MIKDIIESLESQPNVSWMCSEEISRLREYQELEESLGVDILALMRNVKAMADSASRESESNKGLYPMFERLAEEVVEKYNIKGMVNDLVCQSLGVDPSGIGIASGGKQ